MMRKVRVEVSEGAGLENVLRALQERNVRVSRSGGGYLAQCPAHEDRRASLSIGRGNGKALLNCHAGCSVDDVRAALKLPWPALFDNGGKRDDAFANARTDQWMPCQGLRDTPAEERCPGHKEAEYRYEDEDGNLLFATCRCSRKGDGCKRPFAQWRPDPTAKNGRRWNLQGVRRVIYRLPEVLAAVREGRRIWFTEGEKDADLFVSMGEVATTAPMGAGSWLKEYARYFRGAAEVIIVADCDEPGLDHAESVYGDVAKFAGATRVVCSPVNAKGADPSDHFSYGLSIADFEPVPFERVEPRPQMAIRVEREHRKEPVVFNGFSQAAVERSLVGSMLRFGQSYTMAAADIVTDERLAVAAQAAAKLAAQGIAVTSEMVAAQIEETGRGSYERVLAFLGEVERAAFTDAEKPKKAARILRERTMRREIAYMCRAIESYLKDERRTIEEVLGMLGRMAQRQAEEFDRLDEYCAPIGDVFAEDVVEEVQRDNVRELRPADPVVTEQEIEEALEDAWTGGGGSGADSRAVSGAERADGAAGAGGSGRGVQPARPDRGRLGVVPSAV